MTLEQRLALAASLAAALKRTTEHSYDEELRLGLVIGELQCAMDVLKLQALDVDDNAHSKGREALALLEGQ